MMRRTWIAGLALVLVAAACGTSTAKSGHGPSVAVRAPYQLVAATADATAHAKTARTAMTISVTSPELPHAVALDMNGALAFDGSRADFTMNLGSLLPQAGTDASVEVRLLDGVMYMNMAPFVGALSKELGPAASQMLGNVKWLKLDTGDLGAQGGSPAQYTQYLEYLRAVSKGDVTTVGPETVRGVATTHYRATLDPAKVVAADRQRLAKLSPALRPLMEKALDAMANSHTPFVADVWIDGHDMVRRLAMAVPSLTVSAGTKSVTESVSVRVDLYDFGTPVNVQAPPPSEVQDFSALAGGLGSSVGQTTS
ncbi:MAG TPA: hypothetical protein VGI86_21620 [Acidimicrobiia bacterium]|jgi:hypothetical protein